MNTALLHKVESSYQRNDFSSFNVGDTVKVHNVIREGDKTRIQIFQGLVIAKKGSGTRATFTVRKISEGVGVEKIFPIQSPNVSKVELVKSGAVKRSKLYYLRERTGKAALKVKAKSKTQASKLNSANIEVVAESEETDSEKSESDSAVKQTK